ncbi:MAG: hypothetical protein U1F43_24445 [Myxococcota bacterium]
MNTALWLPTFMRTLALVAPLAVVGGCDSSADEVGGKSPYGPSSPRAESTFSAAKQDGTPGTVRAGPSGETHSAGGVAYPVFAVYRTDSANPSGGQVWMTWTPADERAVVAGGRIDWPDSGLVPVGQPFASGELDTPLSIDLAPPVGVAQPLDIAGTALIGDPASPQGTQAFEAVGSYTLAATDAVATTSLGPIAGCRRFEGQVTVLGETHSATFWYHPDLGLVAASADWPPPHGIHADLSGLWDPGASASGAAVLKGMGQIDASHRTFRLDTYDVAQAIDADKTQHAKMLLELRWVDDAKARTSELPALFAPDMGTAIGYYPASFVASPVSLFHPEENGQGFNFWIAYVDQAAKNEPGTATSYHAGVTLPDFVSSPMRVTGRILYHRLAP